MSRLSPTSVALLKASGAMLGVLVGLAACVGLAILFFTHTTEFVIVFSIMFALFWLVFGFVSFYNHFKPTTPYTGDRDQHDLPYV